MKKIVLTLSILSIIWVIISNSNNPKTPLTYRLYKEQDTIQENKIREKLKSTQLNNKTIAALSFGMKDFRNHLYNIEFEQETDEQGNLFWSFSDTDPCFNPRGGNSNGIYSITSSIKPIKNPHDLKSFVILGSYNAKVSILDNSFINCNSHPIGSQNYGYSYKLLFTTGKLVLAQNGSKGYYPLIADYTIVEKIDKLNPNLIVVNPKIKINFND
jgi:hypothetical protein